MADTFNILRNVVERTTCKPGWTFRVDTDDETGGLILMIHVPGLNSYHPEEPCNVTHCFPIPQATFNEKAWRRWVFEMCRRVENHELGEWFKVSGQRPFAPMHGPGEDPYTVHEIRPESDARIIQDGSVMTGDV